MRLYRMQRADLNELLAPKVLESPEDHPRANVRVGGIPGVLIAGQTPESDVEWAKAVRSLTDIELPFQKTTAAAALLLPVDDDTYALTFGQGWRYLRESRIDHEFGLAVAVRMLDPEHIREITRRSLSARARIDRNVVPGGQELWAYGLHLHAELVRRLTGIARRDVAEGLTYTRLRGHRKNFQLTLECGEALSIRLSLDGRDLISDLRELSRISRYEKVHPDLEPLQWVRQVTRHDERYESLNTSLSEVLKGTDNINGEVGITVPGRYFDGPPVQRYKVQIGDYHAHTEELSLDDIRAGVMTRPTTDALEVLRGGRIRGYDEDGEDVGEDTPALQWLAAEVREGDRHYVLLDSEWYELGEEYIRYVDAVVREAFNSKPPWSLPSWNHAPKSTDGKVHESDYNSHVADCNKGFLCLNEKLIHSDLHKRGVEICDLLGPNNELVHVKKVSSKTGSSVLSHLFAQGVVAVDSLSDQDTWARFKERVREQDETRASALVSPPTTLVYAIHRSDKELTPDTLFTFARSALVSAWVTLRTRRVNVQVAVIP
jgi:uncharacterized protein (TIGR04141 family)